MKLFPVSYLKIDYLLDGGMPNILSIQSMSLSKSIRIKNDGWMMDVSWRNFVYVGFVSVFKKQFYLYLDILTQ